MQLLPAIYRLRDEEGDGTLAALLGILAQQAEILGEDLAQLHDDQFIETCAEWVVPYIADLVGARGIVSVESAAFSARAYVANTIRYRRRKGTIAVIEQLARDVTGWPASAVEYFLKLITTQNVNHVRATPFATVDVRDWQAIERLNSAFESSAHTAEVRRIRSGRGRYNIPNVGIFLWRLNAYPLTKSPSVKVDDNHYVLHPLGIDAPMVTRPATETEIEDLAEPLNVPLPISRRALDASVPSFYGTAESDHSFLVYDGANAIDVSKIHVCDLSDGSGGWKAAPAEEVAIDPVLGRLAFKNKPAGKVSVTFHYAFPADIGGGEYEREASFALGDENVVRVPADFATITLALNAVKTKQQAVVEITDSGRYEETLAFDLAERQRIEVRASNGRRPAVILGGDCTIRGGAESRLYLNGLLIAGGTLVVPADNTNKIAGLTIAHCTLVPGITLGSDGSPLRPDLPSLLVEDPNDALHVTLDAAITGALHISPNATSIEAKDSIIDGGPPREAMAIVSGKHTSKPNLTETTPMIDVTIGKRGPFGITLANGNGPTVVDRRNELQSAIRGAHPSFASALVLTDNDANEQLVVLSGTTERIALDKHAADAATLAALKLDAAQRHIVNVFVSDVLPTGTIHFPGGSGVIGVRIGGDAWHDFVVTDATLAGLRFQLGAQIRNFGGPDAYTKALVVSSERRLIVIPGAENVSFEFRAPNDKNMLRLLGLTAAREAIRGPVAGTNAAPLTLDRCTILGPVRTVALPYVSDSVFSAPVIAKRKQTGCVRFSFVPDGSQTPRRYRCQPDLEIADEVARRAKKLGNPPGFPTSADLAQIRKEILPWLVPGFVSTRYGDAAYVQLTRSTPQQIRAGSEKDSEMGAYCMLEQPRREANLRAALDEYLRFGLEAGIFYAT